MNINDIDLSKYPHELPGTDFPWAVPHVSLFLAAIITVALGVTFYFGWATFPVWVIAIPAAYLVVRAAVFNVIRHAVRAGMNDQAEDMAKVQLLSQFMADQVMAVQNKTLTPEALKSRFMGDPV